MCLIAFAFQVHPRYPLILAANRDEFYDRPSAPVAFWADKPDILAGRDLKEMGTWMGIARDGRWAALTNYRDPGAIKWTAPSRGWLVRDYLAEKTAGAAYGERLDREGDRYNGFSLIWGDASEIRCYSPREGTRRLAPGLYGLSNHLLDTPWPKVLRAKEALGHLLETEDRLDVEEILTLLHDPSHPADEALPETGVGLVWERILSPVFIRSTVYGTRSSTVLLIDRRGHVTLVERSFNGHPEPWMTARFEFRISGWSP